jgi:diguanylate cyclase (GGDEF)-like protein
MKLLIKDQTGKILCDTTIRSGTKSLKIGRIEGCDILIRSLSISREHAQVQFDAEGKLCLQDMQSTFGTFVNGKKVQPGFLVPIQPGDKVQLSDEAFLSLESETGDSAPPDEVNLSKGIDHDQVTIFPFFMGKNLHGVKDLFKQTREQIPPDHHSPLKELEKNVLERTKELSAILEVSYALSSLFNYQKLLEYVIDLAIQVTGAERGFIMLYNEENEKLETVAVRKMGRGEIDREAKASSSLVLKCFQTGETIVIGDTSIDPNLLGNKSIVLQRIRSVALTPLRSQNNCLGVLYLDNRLAANVFNNRIQDNLKVFAALASVAIYNTRLFHQATTDGLTGLTNHKHFQQRLLEEFCRSLRHKKPLSLLMIDIDHFKAINDTFGHPVGDQALRYLSKVMRQNMRIHDLPARYGGEEFAILLPETSLEGARIFGEKLRVIIEHASFNVGPKTLKFTISIGAGTVIGTMSRPADLVKITDQALYQAKHSGRNRVTTTAELAAASSSSS